MSQVQTLSYVLLDEGAEGEVRITQRNRDQFFLSLGEAVAACAAFAKSKFDFAGQVADLLETLSKWVRARRDRISAAHLTFRPENNDIRFVVMQKAVEFDSQLSEELTDLDIEIANSEAYDLISLDVLAIPAVSLESANAFLSSGQVFTHAQ